MGRTGPRDGLAPTSDQVLLSYLRTPRVNQSPEPPLRHTISGAAAVQASEFILLRTTAESAESYDLASIFRDLGLVAEAVA